MAQAPVGLGEDRVVSGDARQADRSRRILVTAIRAARYDESVMEEAFADPFFQQLKPAFGRGVNLANALEAPKEGDSGVVLKEEYFDRIKSAGFDSVRLPVRWNGHADASPPYQIDPKFSIASIGRSISCCGGESHQL